MKQIKDQDIYQAKNEEMKLFAKQNGFIYYDSSDANNKSPKTEKTDSTKHEDLNMIKYDIEKFKTIKYEETTKTVDQIDED
jgi:hypothetical protein